MLRVKLMVMCCGKLDTMTASSEEKISSTTCCDISSTTHEGNGFETIIQSFSLFTTTSPLQVAKWQWLETPFCYNIL